MIRAVVLEQSVLVNLGLAWLSSFPDKLLFEAILNETSSFTSMIILPLVIRGSEVLLLLLFLQLGPANNFFQDI